MEDFGLFLELELARVRAKNPRYSMRAFANKLGLEPSQLSKILNGKRSPTEQTIIKILSRLGIRPETYETKLALRRERLKNKIATFRTSKLEMSKASKVAEWPFGSWVEIVAFLSLELNFEKKDVASISKLIGVSVAETREILERLESQGLVTVDDDGIYSKNSRPVADDYLQSSEFRRELQKRFLKKAASSIDAVPVDRRKNGTLTFTLNRQLIPKLQSKIDQFLKSVNAVSMAESHEFDACYNLTIALYPLIEEPGWEHGEK